MADDFQEILKETFEKACSYVKAQAGTLDSTDLLYCYGRYKQATEGQCSIPRPGFFDFQGKQKWDAWHALGPMSAELAMEEYVDHVTNIEMDWEDKLSRGAVKARAGMGVAVSTPSRPVAVAECDKTLFDWCKEGSMQQLASRLLPDTNVNGKDNMGMTLLHWACDRGHSDVVNILLTHNALIDMQDDDGQTPLHFACSCEHVDIVRLLLRHGADPTIQDCDAGMPQDCCNGNADILQLLRQHSSSSEAAAV